MYVAYNFPQGGRNMVSSKKIRPEQLTRARKLLHDLPEKEDGKTRPEAAEFLERDFRKGYSPKELSQLLKNEGIIIPAYLIKRYFRETADAPRQKKSQASAQKTAPAKQSFVVPDLPDEEL